MDASLGQIDGWLADLAGESDFVRRLAASLVSDRDDAEDLAQDAWLAFARRRPSGAEPLAPWWRGVLRRRRAHLVRGERARGKREQARWEERVEGPADAWLERVELERILVEEVRALPGPAREVLQLHYVRGLSLVDIARRLGQPAGSVRARHHRALGRLRERLEARLGAEGRDWRLALAPLAAGAGERGLGAALFGFGLALLSSGKALVAALLLGAAGLLLWLGLRAELPPGGGGLPAGPGEGAVSLALRAEPEVEVPRDTPPPGAVGYRQRVQPSPSPAPPATSARVRSEVRLRLVDGAGRPLAGAKVRGDLAGGPSGGGFDLRSLLVASHAVTSDREGLAVLSTELLAAPRFAELTAVAGDGLVWSRELWVRPGESLDLGEVTLVPGAELRVRVQDGRGRALRAEVELERLDGPPPPLAPAPSYPRASVGLGRTDRRGELSAGPLEPGWVRLWVERDGPAGWPSAALELVAGAPPQLVSIEAPDPEPVRAVAIRALTPEGQPAAGALAVVTSPEGSRSQRVDAGGRKRFEEAGGLARIERLVLVDGAGRGAAIEVRGLTAEAGEVELRLAPARFGELRVSHRGAPLEEFRARLTSDEPWVELAAARGAQGRASLPLPAFDGFDLTVEATGFGRRVFSGLDRRDFDSALSVELEALPVVHGRLLAETLPLAGAKVELLAALDGPNWLLRDGFPAQAGFPLGAAVVTDGDGRFRAPFARAGAVWVWVTAEGRAPARFGPFELNAGIDLHLGDLALGRAGRLEVRVFDAHGRPRAGHLVGVTRQAADSRVARSDGAGWVRFDGLEAGLWQVVEVFREPLLGMTWIEPLEVAPEWRAPLGIAVPEGGSVAVELHLAGSGGRLLARVAEESPGAWRVRVRYDRGRDPFGPDWSRSARPGPDGFAEIAVERAGPHRVELIDPEGNVRAVRAFEADGAERVLELAADAQDAGASR